MSDDPRQRPADPAGTQPKFDPEALRPHRPLDPEAATLWAPPGDADEAAEHPVHPRREDEAAAAQDDGDVAEKPTYSRYSHRVQFALGALLAIGAAGVVLFVAALAGHDNSSTKTITLKTLPAWSPWRPDAATGAEAAQQIADHVGKEYHLPDGRQLVLVTGGAVAYGDLPASIVVRKTAAQGGDFDLLDGASVLYRLCDVTNTKTCEITDGKPSRSRLLLLQREALELALYSFRYLGVTQAVVLIPPVKTATGAEQQPALLFKRDSPGVATAITRPLDQTLSRTTPTVHSMLRAPDARAVVSLTARNIFNYSFSPSNGDASAFLVLSTPGG